MKTRQQKFTLRHLIVHIGKGNKLKGQSMHGEMTIELERFTHAYTSSATRRLTLCYDSHMHGHMEHISYAYICHKKP